MKIVFMGTPEFAVASLKSLLNSEHEIAGVITAPDRPAGRGKKIKSSPIKLFALSSGLKVMQPTNLKNDDFINELKELNADLFVVVAFRMLPELVWSLPPKGCINLHASLLPNYRGAAPINWAIINGEKITGITTFFIEKEIDTGKIIMQKEILIENKNLGELHDELMIKGAELLIKTIKNIDNNRIMPIAQNQLNLANIKSAPKINKATARINWNLTNEQVKNLIKGMSPFPGAWTKIFIDDKELQFKIFKCDVSDQLLQPGEIQLNNREIHIGCSIGSIILAEVQLEGKKRMTVAQFIAGARITKLKCL
jgi:methionyl-tRNA formyltransferase